MNGPSSVAENRRQGDHTGALQAVRRLGLGHDGRIDVVAVGRLLLLASGLVASAATPLLHPDLDGWIALAGVTAAMAALLVLTFFVPWSRLPRRAVLIFPIAVAASVVVLGLAEPVTFAPLTGLLSLCFAYLGLAQPQRTSLFALPPAAAIYLVTYGTVNGALLVRLSIGLCVWTILGEVLAGLTARQVALGYALRTAAFTDVLTGVRNRRDLDLRLSLARPGDSVVICDLDHFKKLNDTFGHETGDRVLADFGAMLRACMREQDYCARYGGEEFVLILPATDVNGAMQALTRMRHHWALMRSGVTFSTGVALCRDGRTHQDTLGAADEALYAAKHEGRNTDRSADYASDGSIASADA